MHVIVIHDKVKEAKVLPFEQHGQLTCYVGNNLIPEHAKPKLVVESCTGEPQHVKHCAVSAVISLHCKVLKVAQV